MDDFLNETVELTLKVSELVDLIETGAVAQACASYEPAIIPELRRLFTELARGLDEAVYEV